jgi:hypothetical protein
VQTPIFQELYRKCSDFKVSDRLTIDLYIINFSFWDSSKSGAVQMMDKREPSQNLDKSKVNQELRSQFELLSAYLDGEVTASERRQVQQWLESDAKIQKLYARLVKLRHTMRSLPVPAALAPIEETIEQVFIKLNRTRWRRLGIAGGTAVAAMALAGLGSVFAPKDSSLPQLVQSSPPEALMVALNKPPIEIPKPAMMIQDKPLKQILPSKNNSKNQQIN